MDPGICYIKPEFLIPEVQITSSDGNTEKGTNKRMLEESVPEAEESNKSKKINHGGKKDRKRGQNKHRPVYKEDRTLHLCHSLVNGPSGDKCTYPNCRYVHDLDKYLESKPKDIGDTCQIFNVKGFCPRGVTCRFASAHMDENRNNIKADSYDPNTPLSTCNGISTELQVKLRKREYDFSKSKKILQQCDRRKDEQKKKQSNEQKPKDEEDVSTKMQVDKDESKENETEIPEVKQTTETSREEDTETKKDTLEANGNGIPIEKLIGSAIDEETPGRDVLKKNVDFFNKLVLSPLTTVGNLPFRRICKEFGADITCGEMACVVPLVKGLTQEWALTKRHESEDIFGVQLCGNNPQLIAQAAQLLQENAKVDYMDLNIGCPIDLIYQQGGGSALMRRTNILEATVRSCSTLLGTTPFTVKMRTGVYADKSVAHELLPKVEEWGGSAVTLHGRSKEQRYTKNANWEYIEECAAKAKNMAVIGNGDILSFEDYNEKMKLSPHVSSVMIGRGALIKPWIFKEIKEQKTWDPTSSERMDLLRKYVHYGLEHWGSDTKGVENTRRFLLEWQSFLYRYIPAGVLENPPQKINQRPQKYRGRDEMETLLSSPNSSDWIKISEMLLGPVPEGFTFLPKHKANSY
ncbi:tRNA-dihydrouridine(47) synthase [NAD(P)(+)]-like [Episyrphus balteatus]|uniref:tRNA-dihydrouridine(47) synthase [NAD(P)(+)]-like n=1 Tax=Episyrphus balteatus TaxID=286459 RepID=UPI0024866759|nr:tRNA-dihydrouridine(47) synthase [NAD(P)(+)]-like [Episyrphus balteatus]